MKYIFDFDDVIFRTTKHRLEHIFPMLLEAGAEKTDIENYYAKMRLEGFSLKSALSYFFDAKDINQADLYEKIMANAGAYVNAELVELIKKLGKENCFLITHGGDEYQNEKISRAGVADLFAEVIVLIGSKKKYVEDICERYSDETVVFIDDKAQYFQELDLKKCKNIRTILYAWQGKEKLLREIDAAAN